MKSAPILLKKALTVTAVCLSLAAFAAPVSADPQKQIVPISPYEIPGTLLHSPTNIRWDPVGPSKTAKVVESADAPGGQAIQINVKRQQTNPWDVRMKAPFDKDISKGDTIELYFWMRAEKTPKGQDAGKVDVVIGRNVEPYDTIIVHEIQPTATWQMYKVSGVAEADFSAAKSDMGFNLAKQKQTIEFGPFYAVKAATSE